MLYVEDNPANLELVGQLIARRSDLRLLSATDGTSGVEYARACLPEVILMDINLPGLSGTAAMKMLRADPATAHIPIIALSANAVPRDIEQGPWRPDSSTTSPSPSWSASSWMRWTSR